MAIYLFECEECGKTFDVKYVGGPPKEPPRIGHTNPKTGKKCHGKLRRKWTSIPFRIEK
jgi:predicted nucleic acid-binding Zn ribbon protein